MPHYSRTLLIALTAALLPVACGEDHAQDDDVRAFAENIQSARLEVGRHQDAIDEAPTLAEIPAEMDRYDRGMGDIRDMMDARMGGMMSHCSGSGMGMMHDRMGGMGSEMQSHREAMTDAATLADAREESAAHTHRMNGMFDDMQRSLGNVGCMMGR